MKKILSATVLLVMIPSSIVLAQEFRKADDMVEMKLGNDVYAAGESITITTNVEGDLTVASGQVNVTGTVGGDLNAAGGAVMVRGTVRDDVRVMGGNITLSGNVGGDVLAFGGNVHIERDARIAGSIVSAGGAVTIDGTIAKNAHITGEKITLNGSIGGDTSLTGQSITINGKAARNASITATNLTLGEKAQISGNLRYWNKEGTQNTSGKVGGTSTFDPALALKKKDLSFAAGGIAAFITVFTILSILSAALSITLFMLLTRTLFTESAKQLRKEPWWSLLLGFLYFVVTPAIILLFAITLIGIPIALALLAMYFISLFFAKILASMAIARLVELYYKKKWRPVTIFCISLGVYIVLKLLFFIPFIGWLLCILIVATAYGALVMVKWEKYKKIR